MRKKLLHSYGYCSVNKMSPISELPKKQITPKSKKSKFTKVDWGKFDLVIKKRVSTYFEKHKSKKVCYMDRSEIYEVVNLSSKVEKSKYWTEESKSKDAIRFKRLYGDLVTNKVNVRNRLIRLSKDQSQVTYINKDNRTYLQIKR